jgi:SAM-dependent methyltransferase
LRAFVPTSTDYSTLRRSSSALDKRDLDYPVLRCIRDELDALSVREYGVVLDYGAGNSPYRSLFRCDRYITADISQNSTASIDIILNKGELSIPDSSVDLALCIFVLEHVPDYQATIRELIRVLKPSGTFFVAVPYISREHETPHDYLRFTSHMAMQMFPGCTPIKIRKAGNAWHAAVMLLYEMHIKNGERPTGGLLYRIAHRIARAAAPLLNITLFARPPRDDDGVFTALVITAIKAES